MNTLNIAGAALLVVLAFGCATKPTPQPLPPPASLPSRDTMPDPLINLDGTRVSSKAEWFNRRRSELKRMFAHYMYGPIPEKPARVGMRLIGDYGDFLGGAAKLRLSRIEVDGGRGPSIDVMLVAPKQPAKDCPVFLVMNFCGNHAVTPDTRVPLPQSWVRDTCPGVASNRATAAGRGAQAVDWPLSEIVRRGYAVATFYSGDVDPDVAETSAGVYAWLARGDSISHLSTNRGTIAAWAWGFQRCVDYLVTQPEIDPLRIAALGHSRNGKTALLAAAFDERIAMAFPHQAGCGGTAPSRGKIGESVKAINDRFPHWFNARFKEFNDTPEKLPFDQNALVALCAPRPVLFSAAQDDQWANPVGQFEVLQAADPVYRFLGFEGLDAPRMPELGKLVDSRLGYYIRPGKHAMNADDWRVFMDFADRHFRKQNLNQSRP